MIYYRVTLQRWGGPRVQWVASTLFPEWEAAKIRRGFTILQVDRYAPAA